MSEDQSLMIGHGHFEPDVPNPSPAPLDDEARWVTIHVFSRKDAIHEGVLVPIAVDFEGEKHRVCFTDTLYAKLKAHPQMLRCVVQTGFEKLLVPHPDDTRLPRRRVIIKDTLWVMQDGEGIIFLEPQDD